MGSFFFAGESATIKDLVDVRKIKILGQSRKAWLVEANGFSGWVSKSCCTLNKSKKTITMPRWLADKNGF